MHITKEKESQLLESLLITVSDKVQNIEAFNPLKTLVLNVGPDYSSILSMRLAHKLSKNGEMSHLIPLDVAYPDDNQERKSTYMNMSKGLLELMINSKSFDLFILCDVSVITGNTFSSFYEKLTSLGIEKEKIITVALFQDNKSVFKCEFVGEYLDTIPEFWWEEPNKHWD
jgi:hypothetical protein